MKALLPLLLICAASGSAREADYHRFVRQERAEMREQRAAARRARVETDRWARRHEHAMARERRAALRESRRYF
jgi:hypothetical protein